MPRLDLWVEGGVKATHPFLFEDPGWKADGLLIGLHT